MKSLSLMYVFNILALIINLKFSCVLGNMLNKYDLYDFLLLILFK